MIVELPDEAAQLAFGATLVRLLATGAGAETGTPASTPPANQTGADPAVFQPGPRPGLVFLQGDLGAGKTTLVRGLLRALGHVGPVRSPTYTLIEPYEHLTPPVYHLDLYRIGDPEELEYLGLGDLLGGEALVLVEWPERGADLLPVPDLVIDIAYAGTGRRLQLRPGAGWKRG